MSCTTTTVTESYDKVITYEPPPVKLTTVYAPHQVSTFYNSYRVPRLHTVYKSVSPTRIHTVISTPRLHTIHTSPARVQTSIVKVTPSPKPVSTTTTTTTHVAPETKLYYPYYNHWRHARFYDDRTLPVHYALPVRSRSTVSVVRNADNAENLVSNKYEYEYKETIERKSSKSLSDLTVEEKVTVTPAQSAAPEPAAEPAAEPAPAKPAEETTTTTTTAFLRPSKSFNGLNTLTYNSYVYDLNHGFDENHKQVTVLKETTNDEGLTVTGNLIRSCDGLLPASRSVLAGAIFNGNSFGLLTDRLSINGSFSVSFSFRTTARNGILMIIVDPHTNDSFFVELYDSQLKATLLIDGEPDSCWTEFSSPILSNFIWVDVNIQIQGNKMTMTVKDGYYTKTHRCILKYPIKGDLYVAGHPATVPVPFACRSKNFFVGDMRDFYVDGHGIRWYGAPNAYNLRYWY